MVSCSYDRTACVWDVAAGKRLKVLSGHEGWVRTGHVSPMAPNQLLTGGGDHVLRLWDLNAGTTSATFTGHTDWVRIVRFAPYTAHRAASAGWDDAAVGVRLWDTRTARCVATLGGHKDAVRALAFTDDGGAPLLWAGDVAGGVLGHDLRWAGTQRALPAIRLEGHTAAITALATHGASRTLLSASADNTVQLWNIAGLGDQGSGDEPPEPETALPNAAGGESETQAAAEGRASGSEAGGAAESAVASDDIAEEASAAADGEGAGDSGDGSASRTNATNTDAAAHDRAGEAPGPADVSSASDAAAGGAAGHSADAATAEAVSAVPPVAGPAPTLVFREHGDWVSGLDVAPDRTVISTAGDGKALVWDLISGKVLTACQGSAAALVCCASGDDETTQLAYGLASGDLGTVVIPSRDEAAVDGSHYRKSEAASAVAAAKVATAAVLGDWFLKKGGWKMVRAACRKEENLCASLARRKGCGRGSMDLGQ